MYFESLMNPAFILASLYAIHSIEMMWVSVVFLLWVSLARFILPPVQTLHVPRKLWLQVWMQPVSTVTVFCPVKTPTTHTQLLQEQLALKMSRKCEYHQTVLVLFPRQTYLNSESQPETRRETCMKLKKKFDLAIVWQIHNRPSSSILTRSWRDHRNINRKIKQWS